jgi:hypothetical protein
MDREATPECGAPTKVAFYRARRLRWDGDVRQIGAAPETKKAGHEALPLQPYCFSALLLLRRALHFLAVDRHFVTGFFVFAGIGEHIAFLLSRESDRGERCYGERGGDQSGQKLRHDVSSFEWMGVAS